jgi:HKD family nuclease
VQNPIWNISTAKVMPWSNEKNRTLIQRMQASLETCTRYVLIISFFFKSNESNFFSSDCEKAAQHLSLAWLLFLGRS